MEEASRVSKYGVSQVTAIYVIGLLKGNQAITHGKLPPRPQPA